jgi:putative iron-only hydrogenase system regulator
METRVAVIAIIVEDEERAEELNHILHQYGQYVIGRMGIPYREKGMCIISVAVDAPQDVTSALSGKIGRLPGISAKTVYSAVSNSKEIT